MTLTKRACRSKCDWIERPNLCLNIDVFVDHVALTRNLTPFSKSN